MMRMLLTFIALMLAMAPYELQRDPLLHSAITDTPLIVDLAYADPATWGDGVPGLEANTVVRTSLADIECKRAFCVSR
jgi:hypothetical protein